MKPGGPVGIAGAGLMREIDGPVPDHLREWWTQDLVVPALGGLVAAALGADRHPGRRGGRHPARRLATLAGLAQAVAPDNAVEIAALEADRGRYLGYVRAVGRRRADAALEEPIVSVPPQYTESPLLRGSG